MSYAVACAIPARLDSSRFPRKLLADLGGLPVLARTLDRARAAGCFSRVICVTDAPELAELARARGCEAALGGPAANGSERIAKALGGIPEPGIVNLQGDEPLFPLEDLRALAGALRARPDRVHTLVHAEAPSEAEMADPNRVKAILAEDAADGSWLAVDFRRRPAMAGLGGPSLDAPGDNLKLRVHMGAYAYPRDFLRLYASLPPSPRETSESHELLRTVAAELPCPAWAVQARPARARGQAIDVPADLEAARRILRAGPGPAGSGFHTDGSGP